VACPIDSAFGRMTILVCPLSKVGSVIAARAPERIVSLLDPDSPSPYVGVEYANRHLRLSFHDVEIATWDEDIPTPQDIGELLAFVEAWARTAPLLIHCRAGVGRSTAAAFVTACALNPQADEKLIALALRRVAPFARPNEMLVRRADAALARRRRMSAAIEETRPIAPRDDRPDVAAPRSEGTPFELPSTFP
jgi:predicted protein tyrosine phosphatase